MTSSSDDETRVEQGAPVDQNGGHEIGGAKAVEKANDRPENIAARLEAAYYRSTCCAAIKVRTRGDQDEKRLHGAVGRA